ncbi:MAG: hypothetical protein AAF628_22210 [Planctomycetota bacterium]
MHRPLTRLACLLPIAGFAACASTNPSYLDENGTHLKDLTPAPFRVAVGPIDAEELRATEDAAYALTLQSGTELRERVIDAMVTRFDAASAVFAVTDREQAAAQGADIYLEPRLARPVAMEYREVSSSWPGSLGLWLVTWVGGLVVDSSTYDCDLTLDVRVYANLQDRSEQIQRQPVQSGAVDLSFMERNDFMSLGTLQALILPPFWTTDSSEATSASLTDAACEQLAANLTRYLKLGPLEQDSRASITLLDLDQQGATTGDRKVPGVYAVVDRDQLLLKGLTRSRYPVREVAVELNGTEVAQWSGDDLASFQQQQDLAIGEGVSGFQQPFPPATANAPWLALQPEKNTVVVRVRVEGEDRPLRTSRTFVFYRGVR